MTSEAELRTLFGVKSSQTLGRNDYGWLRVFRHKQLNDAGFFRITAAELKELSLREPRLMAKHDSTAARPWIFKELGLNIIPLSRFEYLVGKFDLFAKFPEPETLGPVRYMPFPDDIESLNPDDITSEAAALNASALSHILDDFLETSTLQATVAGRMSTGSIDVRLACGDFQVSKAQMEIDAGLESADVLGLIEAKNHLSDDFNIRQLYFPFRRFSQSLSKPVAPVYQVYSNGIFHLYRFDFDDALRPESIRLVKSARYTLTPSSITLDVIDKLLKTVPITAEPEAIPFPQADSFARVINLCEQLQDSELSVEAITENYDFTSRQTNYYTGAAKYLGLVNDTNRMWSLTDFGAKVMASERNDRNVALIKALLRHEVFHVVLARALERGEVPDRATIVSIMEASNLELSASTVTRRAGTVLSWMQWVWSLATTEELKL